jgi:hypothetical protein
VIFRHEPAAFPAKRGNLPKPALAALFLFLLLQNIYGFETPDRSREFGIEMEYQYNLGFDHCWNFFVFGSVEFNKLFLLRGGVSAGRTGKVSDINGFLLGRFSFPFYMPLNVKLAYLCNKLPEYQTNIHTILPLAGLEWKYFGFSAGTTLRFTGFHDNVFLFEVLPAYSVHVMFINFKKVRVGFRVANFSDYESGNLGSYSYRFKSKVYITDHLAVTNNFEILISGSISRLVSVYSYSYKGGVVFSW